jgi:hypothetical protein
MLHRYAFSNFQSFRERTEVDLRLNGKVPPLPWEVEVQGQRVSLLTAVLGPNASGKTALLKPLVFVDWFLRTSFSQAPDSDILVYPHFAATNEPTVIELEAGDGRGQLWRYEVKLTSKRVLSEALYQRRSEQRFSYVFVRTWDEQKQIYHVKQQNFGFKPSEASKARANASLLSTAAQYGVPLAQELVHSNLQSNVVHSGRRRFDAPGDLSHAAKHFELNALQQSQMVELLKAWDLGLSDVQIRELSDNSQAEAKAFWFPFGIHLGQDGVAHELPFFFESSGTQSAFVLLSKLLPVLAEGGIAVIDEFESDLHPHMLEPILDLFAHLETNPHRAQLIFTCHSTEVLNLLHKSQVVLVEKGPNCESSAWRLDSVRGIRNDDNFYAKYMAGAYGAVPQL